MRGFNCQLAVIPRAVDMSLVTSWLVVDGIALDSLQEGHSGGPIGRRRPIGRRHVISMTRTRGIDPVR